MIIPWILTAIALIGAYYNSNAKKEGFYFWIVSNAGFCIYNAFLGEMAMSFLFAAYLAITLNGIYKWK